MVRLLILALAVFMYVLISWHFDELIRSLRFVLASSKGHTKNYSPSLDGEYHNHI